MSIGAKWLKDEDSKCFEDRLTRLEWLTEHSPTAEYWTFPSDLHAKYLFDEARYCFVYAQFLATILLGLAYIEITLAALFYGAGRNDLERTRLSELLRKARLGDVISENEFQELERVRNYRNTHAHFRRPGYKHGLEARSIRENAAPYEVIEQDATAVIAVTFQLVAKNAV